MVKLIAVLVSSHLLTSSQHFFAALSSSSPSRRLIMINTLSSWIAAKTSTVGSDSALGDSNANFSPKASSSDEYGIFREGFVPVTRRKGRSEKSFSLYYRIYHPEQQDTHRIPPLVVLHGGPSLPSQYLYPLVQYLREDRPIIFYDQLGCGKSDQPKDKKFYSIHLSLNDLRTVVDTLLSSSSSSVPEATSYHLLGHSYGGVLAYEYTQMDGIVPPRTLILSNASFKMKLASDEYDRMYREDPKAFWTTHACRAGMPPALQDAMKNLGTVWGGMPVVLDYVARPPAHPVPPCLVVSGKHDFGLKATEGWVDLLGSNVEYVCLENCAHYPHLEDGAVYGRHLEDFMNPNDN